MILGLGLTLWAVGRTTAQLLTALGMFGAMVGLLVVMHALMVRRHLDVVKPDLRRCYYGLVTCVLAAITLAYALHAATVLWPLRLQCLPMGPGDRRGVQCRRGAQSGAVGVKCRLAVVAMTGKVL
jgi:hypothetical protein